MCRAVVPRSFAMLGVDAVIEQKSMAAIASCLARSTLGLDERGKLGSHHHREQRSEAAALFVVQRRIGAALIEHAHRFDIGGPRRANQRQSVIFGGGGRNRASRSSSGSGRRSMRSAP